MSVISGSPLMLSLLHLLLAAIGYSRRESLIRSIPVERNSQEHGPNARGGAMTDLIQLEGLLANRTIVLAGGTGNVGRVLVDAFLRTGATVVVPSRVPAKLEHLRAGIPQEHPGHLATLEGEIADDEAGPALVARITEAFGPIDAAIASLGRFVPVNSLLDASSDQLRQVIDGYLIGHFATARALIPAIREGGSYTMINGPLAFQPMFAPASLVSTVTAAQAMLARILIEQVDSVRINELVLYTPFGWGDDPEKQPRVTQSDVARYACHLVSDNGDAVRGETIHLDSPERLTGMIEGIGRSK